MATLQLTKKTTVGDLRKQFNDAFGAQVKLYNGNKVAELTDSLGALGLTAEGTFECRSSLTVASFIERMKQNHGLKVKVYTCDEWVAVLDGLTLESAGKVKKNAVKADMESMIAYQRTNNGLQGYEIEAREDGGYTVRKDGVECENTKAAMREIAGLIGLDYDDAWTTRQFGAKLMKALEGISVSAPAVDNSAAERAAAEKAKADAEAAAKAKAEAEKAKAEAERIAAESAAAVAAKAAADKAKAELERIKAETAKAQAEAEKAKITESKPTKSTSKWKNGVLPGLFSVAANKKVHFSMGNLQFHPKKYEFRFAEHQWDIIGKDNEKISPTYDGWIDLFGYGTSSYMGCEPTEKNREWDNYPLQDIANTNYDWGIYNPISNGGDKEGLWRIMTKEEWTYMLNERPNASKLHIKAMVNNNKGYLLLPDDFYEKRIRIAIDSTPSNFSDNNFSDDNWRMLEEAGCVFFACSGIRRTNSTSDKYAEHWEFPDICLIWASGMQSRTTWFRDHPAAYRSGEVAYACFDDGLIVRLVQDVK